MIIIILLELNLWCICALRAHHTHVREREGAGGRDEGNEKVRRRAFV